MGRKQFAATAAAGLLSHGYNDLPAPDRRIFARIVWAVVHRYGWTSGIFNFVPKKSDEHAINTRRHEFYRKAVRCGAASFGGAGDVSRDAEDWLATQSWIDAIDSGFSQPQD